MGWRRVSTYEKWRHVVCLKCATEFTVVTFPRRCDLCGAHSSWIVGAPVPHFKTGPMIRRLRLDRGARGLSADLSPRQGPPASTPRAPVSSLVVDSAGRRYERWFADGSGT